MSLEGKKVVFTGSCSKLRVDMIQEAGAAGLIVLSMPHSKMDYWYVGEGVSDKTREGSWFWC